jgi:uncharacterized Tic20 family protein
MFTNTLKIRKKPMTKRLRAWLFIAISVVVMSFALAPMMRALIGIDEKIQMNFFTVVTLLIGGLMCGLTGMILLIRKPQQLSYQESPIDPSQKRSAAGLHLSALLIFTCIPLLNFFVCYWYWLKARDTSSFLDYHGREALNLQVAVYLYLLVSLFLAYIFVGVLMVMLVLMFTIVVSVYAAIQATRGEWFSYPASMAIVSRQGRPPLKTAP